MRLVLVVLSKPGEQDVERVACEGHSALIREYAHFWPEQYPEGKVTEGATWGECPVPLIDRFDQHREA